MRLITRYGLTKLDHIVKHNVGNVVYLLVIYHVGSAGTRKMP